jgi:UDP-N-acetyl-D-glucosamine dehydrogenase
VPFEAIEKADIVIIATDHSKVDYKAVAARARVVLDTRNATKNFRNDAKAKIISL